MDIFLKRSLLFFTFFMISFMGKAQDNSYSTAGIIGIGTPILDGGTALQLGINPALKITPYFSVEGQLSFMHTRIKGTFISGNTGINNSTNLLTGGRVYFIRKDSFIRAYANLLLGANYYREEIDNVEKSILGLGISTGAYLEINNKFLAGISIDTPEHFMLKMGYNF